MSLQAFLDRFIAKVNPAPSVAMAVADDGSGDPVTAGKPSPLRCNPTDCALIVETTNQAAVLAAIQKQSQISSSVVAFDWSDPDLTPRLYAEGASGAQIGALGTIGSVTLDGSGNTQLPLDLTALSGGKSAWVLFVASAPTDVRLEYETPLNVSFPVVLHDVASGEFKASRVKKIWALGADITMIEIHYGDV